VKLREFFYLFGLKPRPRSYDYEVRTTDLGADGVISYAQWLHPKAYRCEVTADLVAEHRQFVRPGDFCIDVGAHSGDTSLPLGIAAGLEGCVLAMEPNRYVFPTLKANAELNRKRANIVPVMAAATSEDGQFTFSYGDPGFCNGGDAADQSWLRRRRMLTLDVQGLNLNELLHRDFADRLDRLRFVKTDTEGHDLEVLESIADLIRKKRPYLHCEVFKHSAAEQRRDLHAFLIAMGYDVHLVTDAGGFRGPKVTEDQLCDVDHCDILAAPKKGAAMAA
jgi:FkbM family methyltransferase